MLEGKLVRLRAMEPGDIERAYTWVNDPEVTRWLASLRYPQSYRDEERWLSDGPANSFAGGVRLAIETKDGAHIGGINLHMTHPEDCKAGLGIMIGARDRWAQGYGSDAIVTLLRFAFHEMNLNRVWLHVFADHERAIATYLKCGFREEARLRQDVFQEGRHSDVIVMGILRDEFATHHRTNQD